MTTSDREVVAVLERAIVQRIGEPRYRLWFDGKTRFTWDDGGLLVGVPNLHFQEWLQKTFTAPLRDAAEEALGRSLPVRFAIDPELFRAARQAQQETPEGVRGTKEATTAGDAEETKRPEPERGVTPARRWRQLADFVSGPANRVAHASAVRVVEVPGQECNPLVLHGPVGTGKTHLLEGVYAGLRRSRPAWRIAHVTAEEFTHRFVQAMRLGKLGNFRKQYRECDALLVDDLHFLAGKKATQEEFLHTLDVHQVNGRQVVVTCDCHPRLADDFVPELSDRLLGGAVWGLSPPDPATRLEILRARATGGEPRVPEEVLRMMAEQLRGNVRELEGALHSVRHLSRLAGKPADLALAREALGELLRHAARAVPLADVDRAVCTTLGLELGSLQGKDRTWSFSHPRMLAMYLARKHTGAAYSEIGQFFGGRNHSTVVAAEKKVRAWLAEDRPLGGEQPRGVREVVERIERALQR